MLKVPPESSYAYARFVSAQSAKCVAFRALTSWFVLSTPDALWKDECQMRREGSEPSGLTCWSTLLIRECKQGAQSGNKKRLTLGMS